MALDPLWDLDRGTVVDIAGRRLEEEERLGRHRVVELLGMVSVVAADRDDLAPGSAES